MPKDYETTRTALYGMLQDAGAKGLPDTAEEFVSKLDDENTRRGLYQTLKDSDAKGLPDWDSFNARLTPSANDNETTTTTTTTTTINEPTQWETSSTQDNNIQGTTTIDEWQPSKTVREIRDSMAATSNVPELLSGYGYGKNISTEEGLNKVVGDYKNLVDLQFYEKDLRDRIAEEAQQMGIPADEYTNYLKQLMVEDFRDNIIQEQVSNATPTGVMDYFKKKLGDGLIGSLLKLGRTTYQNQIDEIAKQQYEETISPWIRAIGGGLELVADAPFFGVTGKVTGAVLKGIIKKQLSKYVAKGIGMAQAERLAEAEVAQSLAKRFGSHLLAQTAGSAATLGAYEGVKTAVQQQALTGETDWKDVADATLGGAITGAAIGVAGKAAHAVTADLAGWRLAMGKALGFGLETGAFVGSEELNSLRKGEGFIPLDEATLESAISLVGIKIGAKLNPATWKPTITEIRSIFNPSVKGTYKFSDIERKQLQELFDDNDIFANIEKLSAEQTKAKAEGESAKTIDNSQQVEETRKAISQGLQNVLNNKELDYTTKAKLIRIVAGDDVNLPLPIIAGYETTENDETGEYTLVTRDLNGYKIQTEQFKSQKGLDERVAQLDRQIQQNVETYNDIIAKPIEDSYNEAYNIGRQTTDPQQMSAYNYAYAATQDEARQTFSPEMIEQLDANPIGTLTDLARQALEERDTDKKEDAIERYNLAAEYVGAKRRVEGMQEGNTDRINQAVAQNDERIDVRMHKGTSGKQDDFVGLVVPVTTKGVNGNVQVYVIGGEIVRNDNGTINRERSSDFINIIDEEGNVTSISPDDIISVGDPYNAEEAKRQQGEQIRQRMQRQYEDDVEGRVPFNQGDEYVLADEQGNSYSVKIIGDAVDEQGQPIEGQVVVELGDGKQQTMSREAIQDGVDRANMARVTEQETPQEETTQEPRQYKEKEVIKVKTPDNKEIDASINKVNDDGTIEVFTADEMKFDSNEEEGNFHTFTPEQLTAIEIRRESSTLPEEIEGTVLGGIPKDDNGKPLWESATPADAYTGLLEQAEGDVDDTRAVINDMLADKQDVLKSAEKALSKAEKAATDEEVRKATKGMDASEKLQYRKDKRAAIEKARENVEKARQSADFWQKVLDEANKPAEEKPATPQEEAVVEEQVETPAPTAEQQANTTTLKPKRRRTTRYAKRDAALGDYVDLRDYILRFLANADHILAWSRNPRVNTMKGLSAELGYGRGELPHYRWLLRGWDKGGISVDQLAETLLVEYSEVTGIPMENLPDDTEVKNIILDILQSHSRPKAMMEEAEARHKAAYETQDPNAYEEALDTFTTRIADEAEEMGVPVTIIKDIEELQEIAEQLGMEQSIDEKIKADTPIYGWAKNNRYYLYAPDIFEEGAYNLDTALEVARDKMEHEGVVHVGMRLRLGDKGYNNLCKQIYKGMSKESRDSKLAYQWENNLDDRRRESVLEDAEVDKPTSTEWNSFSTEEKAKILSVYGDRLTQGAADEYVADIAEKIRRGEELSQKERTIWQKISDYVKKLLGKETAMTDQDIADEILATKEYLKMQKEVADKTKEREESQPQDQEEAESMSPEEEEEMLFPPFDPNEEVPFSVGEGLESEENLVNLQPKKEKEDVKRIDSSRNGVGAPIREGTQRRGTVGGGSGLVQGAKNKASRIESRNVSPRNNASGTRLDKSISRRAVREGNAEGERIISQESNFTNRIKGLTDQFNIPFVILNTPEDLEVVARRNGLRDFQDEEYLASHFVKGFVSDNVPYLYVPDILGEAIEKDIDLVTAAVRAVFHEGVSHYGLGRMLGRYYDDFCDNVYRGLSKEDREKNLAYVWSETLDDDTRTSLLNKFGKDSGTKWKDLTEGERDQVLDTVGKDITRGAADEHIANIAEKVATDKVLTKDERSFWERFTDWVRTLFGAKGLTDKEIAEAVRLSRDLYSKENGEDGEVEGNIEKAHEILDREAPETRFSIGNTASNLSNNLGVDIDTTDRGRSEKDKYIIDPQTGKISIVVGNHNSPEDVERTVLTASVAQHGLRTLFGERYDTFLDNIYSNSARATREEIAQIATRNGWDFRKATEEYLANVAREGDIDANNAWWKYVKTQFQQMLQDKGFDEISAVGGYGEDGKLTDNDLRYVLMRNNADLQGAMGVAQDIDMQNSLGVGNYRESEPTDEDDDLTWFSVGNKRDRSGIERRKEVVDNMFNLLSHNKSNLEQRNKTLQAVSKLYQAVQTQGKYDRETVSLLVNTINDMIENNLLNPSRGETKRLLSDVKNSMDRSIGGSETNFVKSVQTLGNIIADNQLRTGRNALEEALEAKVARVDATGIKKQGEVDEQTANILKSIEGYIYGNLSRREADNLGITEYVSTEQMRDMLDEAEMDMGSSKDAAARYAALRIALDYREKVQEPNARRKEIRDDRDRQAEKWREQVEKGEITESERRKLQKEYNEDVDKVLLDSKLQSAADLYDIVNDVSDIKKEGKVRAKSFITQVEENIQDVNNAMENDLNGVSTIGQRKITNLQKVVNNKLVRFFASPLLTYEQVFKLFGKNSPDGEGWLYNKFVGGWCDATTKEASGLRKAKDDLNAKTAELFGEGTRFTDLYSLTKNQAGVLNYFDNGEYVDHPVSIGNLLYIYMADKMPDGGMKLRCMGIAPSDVENIKNKLDTEVPHLTEMADWIQSEFLPELREKYNDTYRRMYGVSMDNIIDYVPLKIFQDAIPNKGENRPENQGSLSTTTSAIKQRTINNLPLDITSTDGLSVILDNIQEMEHWNAFAELNRDLNTLLSNPKFRARVKNMTTAYGAGEVLLDNVKNVFRLAVDDYVPQKGGDSDKVVASLGQTVAASKIALRLNTALKQFASIVNYAPDTNIVDFSKAMAQAFAGKKNTWNWCMENIPLFQKRWMSRTEGDTRLEVTDDDFSFWKNKWVDKIKRWGITPNAFVDALTVSIGTKAMYDTKYNQYIKDGYDKEKAHEKAVRDATLLYNQTQQSSERAFINNVQVDRTIASVAVTLFRNASMSYTRQVVQAARNLKRIFATPKKQMIESMTAQYKADGLNDEQASEAAERRYNRAIRKETARLAVFSVIAPLVWRVAGSGFPAIVGFILGGNQDDEKQQLEDDFMQSLMLGWAEGLAGGQTITDEIYSFATEGHLTWKATKSSVPLLADISDIVEAQRNNKTWEMCNEIVNLATSLSIGTNPETLENAIYGLMEYCDSDKTLRDALILYSNLTNVPRSQINKIRLDEMEISGEEALSMTPEEFVKRYADAQARYRTGILYPILPEEEKKRYEDSTKRKLEGQIGGQQLNDDYKEVTKSFDEINKTLNEIDKNVTAKTASYGKAISNTIKGAINRNRKKAEHDKLGEGVYEQIEEIKSLQGRLNKRNNGNLRTKWWEATTPEEAQQYSDDISATMQEIIEKVNALPDDLKERAQRILEEQTKTE